MLGLVVCRHVLDQLRQKLDDEGKQMILVEYHSTRGYKLYDPTKRRIVISRDVIFDDIKVLHQAVSGYQ